MYCECGCGCLAPISKINNKRYGWVKGFPKRYIFAHACKKNENRINARLKKLGEKNPNWNGNNALENSARGRAERRFQISKCENCGESGHDRHHVDGNVYNNFYSNIKILCRRCHMAEDGRLEKLKERNRRISLHKEVA